MVTSACNVLNQDGLENVLTIYGLQYLEVAVSFFVCYFYDFRYRARQ